MPLIADASLALLGHRVAGVERPFLHRLRDLPQFAVAQIREERDALDQFNGCFSHGEEHRASGCEDTGVKLTVVLLDNGGFASIGGLSKSLGSAGFGTRYRFRAPDGTLSGERIPVDFVANAKSLGTHALRAKTVADLEGALKEARKQTRTTVIVIETDPEAGVGGYESWWDVPPAETSEQDPVRAARSTYEEARRKERWFL